MVVDTLREEKTDRLFHALSDATRRNIVERTFEREYSISALARMYPMTFAAVQKHVAVLERSELVIKRRHGREQFVRSNAAAVQKAQTLLAHYESLWRGRVDAMGKILEEDARKKGKK
jgi:DNA-binding transcriptional ArsR family regulator